MSPQEGQTYRGHKGSVGYLMIYGAIDCNILIIYDSRNNEDDFEDLLPYYSQYLQFPRPETALFLVPEMGPFMDSKLHKLTKFVDL